MLPSSLFLYLLLGCNQDKDIWLEVYLQWTFFLWTRLGSRHHFGADPFHGSYRELCSFYQNGIATFTIFGLQLSVLLLCNKHIMVLIIFGKYGASYDASNFIYFKY